MNSFCCAEHPNAFSLANHSPGSVIPVCRQLLNSASDFSYEDLRNAAGIHGRRIEAQKTAAEVRSRYPHMRPTRLTPRRDRNGEIIV